MSDFTNHQKKIISRYYDNREQIDEQRLSELVTNLFLSEGKKRAKFWQTAEDVMTRLKVPTSRIKHVIASNDPAILAEVVKDLQAGNIKFATSAEPSQEDSEKPQRPKGTKSSRKKS